MNFAYGWTLVRLRPRIRATHNPSNRIFVQNLVGTNRQKGLLPVTSFIIQPAYSFNFHLTKILQAIKIN